jgi:hypothetical protein
MAQADSNTYNKAMANRKADSDFIEATQAVSTSNTHKGKDQSEDNVESDSDNDSGSLDDSGSEDERSSKKRKLSEESLQNTTLQNHNTLTDDMLSSECDIP